MPIALIGAAIGAAGMVGSSLISSSANSHAADVAAANNAANNKLSQDQYNATKGLIQPYVDKGNTAADALQGFLGLGGDPAKTQAAFDSYLGSTGYQFTRQQGIDAATQSAAGAGLLNSGGALKALQDRGTGLAQQYGQSYVDNLGGVANRGTSAINALTGAGAANVAGQTANNNTGTAARTSAITANGAIAGGLINGLASTAGKLIGASSFGASSFGGGNALTGASTPFNQPGYAPFGG